MIEGGKRLARVKKALEKRIGAGVSAHDIEVLADELILKEGGKPSFKMVPGYSWATCVNVNDELVHGIPTEEVIFRKGDVVSVDVGMYYKGFHTDTSFTLGIKPSASVRRFLEVGKEALNKAVSEARVGRRVWDISRAIEEVIKAAGFSPIRALVGHGVGRELHEDPQIPCFLPGKVEESARIEPGMVFAIEIMYAAGTPEVEKAPDGWTIRMRDGKISGLFEETVAVSAREPQILTQ